MERKIDRKNYKSDFPAVLKLRDARGNEVLFPDCDWEAVFWAFSKGRTYRASCIRGEYTNCLRREDGRICVIFDNHNLGTGVLKWEPHFMFPDALFPDGVRDLYSPEPLDIELVTGAGDYPTTAEVEASLPLIKGDKGDRGDRGEKGEKGDGFTPAQIAKLDALPEAEALSARIDAAARRGFVDKWLSTLALFPDMPTYKADVAATKTDGSQFGLNGLVMGYEIAKTVMAWSQTPQTGTDLYNYNYTMPDIPTLFPAYLSQPNLNHAWRACPHLQVITLYSSMGTKIRPSSAINLFAVCRNLETIYGVVDFSYVKKPESIGASFQWCEKLKSVNISGLPVSLDLRWSPLLSLESITYLIDHAANSSPITVTVHPTVYAKLTDGTDEQWGALPAAAAAKHISFATV